MIELVGWLGAALVLASYAQSNTVRLRQINLLASVALLSFNFILGIWPNVALELALAVVNTRRLLQLRRPSQWAAALHRPALAISRNAHPPEATPPPTGRRLSPRNKRNSDELNVEIPQQTFSKSRRRRAEALAH
jgi:hypothetical protein